MRISDDLYRDLQSAAQETDRSISYLGRKALEQFLGWSEPLTQEEMRQILRQGDLDIKSGRMIGPFRTVEEATKAAQTEINDRISQ